MEIRQIRPDEAEDFLRLLCSVFSLDLERARGVYYSEPMYDLQRKWALVINGELVSICSTSPLEFGWGRAHGIAGVATHPAFRRMGYAKMLLDHVHHHSTAVGEPTGYLFAKNPSLYRQCGYEIIDEVIRGPIQRNPHAFQPQALSTAEVQAIYTRWASENPARLRRDSKRWDLWTWNLKTAVSCRDGYFCLEGSQCREAIDATGIKDGWPISYGCEWHGLRSVTEMAEVPLLHSVHQLYFMGKNSPDRPQMFLSDQF